MKYLLETQAPFFIFKSQPFFALKNYAKIGTEIVKITVPSPVYDLICIEAQLDEALNSAIPSAVSDYICMNYQRNEESNSEIPLAISDTICMDSQHNEELNL